MRLVGGGGGVLSNWMMMHPLCSVEGENCGDEVV